MLSILKLMATLEKLMILRHSYLVAAQYGGLENAIYSFRQALQLIDHARKKAARLVAEI
jgi:hypothetical protein